MPLLPMTPTTADAVARERVELHPREAERAVAEQQHDLALGMGELRRQRVAGPRPEAAERPRVQPAAGREGLDHAPGVGDEVAAVADDDRVAVEQRAELAVDAHRMQRRALVGQQRALARARSSSSVARSDGDPLGARGAARRRAARARRAARPSRRSCRRTAPPPPRADTAAPAPPGRSRRSPSASPNAPPKPSRKSIGTPISSATSAPRSPLGARAREEQLVVGRHAAARQAVEEHGDPQLLDERAQRLLAVRPSTDRCPP